MAFLHEHRVTAYAILSGWKKMCILLFQIQWADACLLVYSVTDRSSFEYAQEILNTLKRTPTNSSPAHGPAAASAGMPLALLGNKTDLDHLRQVCCMTRSLYLLSITTKKINKK